MDLECIETACQSLQLRHLRTHGSRLLRKTAAVTCGEARAKGFEKWRKKVHQHVRLVADDAEALRDCADTNAKHGYQCDKTSLSSVSNAFA